MKYFLTLDPLDAFELKFPNAPHDGALSYKKCALEPVENGRTQNPFGLTVDTRPCAVFLFVPF